MGEQLVSDRQFHAWANVATECGCDACDYVASVPRGEEDWQAWARGCPCRCDACVTLRGVIGHRDLKPEKAPTIVLPATPSDAEVLREAQGERLSGDEERRYPQLVALARCRMLDAGALEALAVRWDAAEGVGRDAIRMSLATCAAELRALLRGEP